MRAESRYRQIARTLRREIQERSLPLGGQLPSEKQLEERFDASRNTIRLALGMLRNQGLIVSRPGRGHFVQDVVPETFYANRSRGGPPGLNESGMTGQMLEELQLLSATPDIASRLRVPEGDMTVVRRMYRFSGEISGSISSAYYPMNLVGGTPLMLPEDVESALSVLAEHGHRQVGFVDELTTRTRPGSSNSPPGSRYCRSTGPTSRRRGRSVWWRRSTRGTASATSTNTAT